MAEQRHHETNLDAYSGDGFSQQYHEQYEQHHQVDLERDFEPNSHVDSSGSEQRHSAIHYDSSSSGKLFVGGISWETTEETFSDYFSKYGDIVDSVIMTDKHSGRPRGFGFVTFSNPAAADMVLRRDHIIDGRSVEVKKTVPRADINDRWVSRTKKIFVGGIPPSLTEDEFKDYFSSFGRTVEHQIMIDHNTGRSRGFGFITFDNEDAVEKIFSGGEIHELGGKQVEIKKAVPKRVTGDYNGNTAKAQGGSGGYEQYGSGVVYDGKMGRAGYSVYGPYGAYGVNYASFYGGYGYGFGYGGPMYMNPGYGMGGYGIPGGYGCAAGYGNGGNGVSINGYGNGNNSKGCQGSGGSGVGVNGYENGNNNKGCQGSGGSVSERYHPYRY